MSHPLQELERNHMAEASPQNKQENALKLGAGSDSDSRGTSLASSEDYENDPLGGQKRKRRAIRWSASQNARLLQLFNQTTHPTTQQRTSLANELGVEPVKVLYWFDTHRRKRSRLSRTDFQDGQAGSQLVIRPRASDAILSRPPEVIKLDDCPETRVPGLADSEVRPASHPDPEPLNKRDRHDGNVDNTVAHPSTEEEVICLDDSEPQSGDVTEIFPGQPIEAPTNASLQVQTPVDGQPTRRIVSTQLPVSECTGKSHEDQLTDTCCPRESNARMQEGFHRKTLAEETEQKQISPISVSRWSKEWNQAQQFRIDEAYQIWEDKILAVQPLQTPPASGLVKLNKAEVAAFLPGCKETLDSLVQILHGMQSDFTKEALRMCILDLATRKSLQPKQGDDSGVDNLNDKTPQKSWVWELRALQSLPRHLQPQAKAVKNALNEASSHLKGLRNAKLALEALVPGKSVTRAENALSKIEALLGHRLSSKQQNQPNGTPDNKSLPTASRNEGPTASLAETHPADKPLAPQASDAVKTESTEKEALRAQKEAIKQEKEVQKAARDAEREKARIEKEQEKEQQRQEKELQKQEKKLKTELAGFGSMKTIEKSRSAFTNFFKKTTPVAVAAKKAPTPSPLQPSPSPLAVRSLNQSYSPATQDPLRAKAEEIDATLRSGISNAAKVQNSVLSSWKQLPKHRHTEGQPPTWARRRGRPSSGRSSPSLDEDVHIVDNYWRRKFLWFPAEKGDDGIYYQQPHWGVYYGSWSKTSAVIKPRRPFVKDSGIDYEVFEDEEWEPEPEGENLSNDEGDDLEPMMEDSATDGFFVPDGQLSDDEGISSAQQGVDDLLADQDTGCSSLGVDLDEEASVDMAAWRQASKVLEGAMRKARPRPLIISCLSTASQTTGYYGCLTGEASLLAAFNPQVVTHGLELTLPTPDEDDEGEEEGQNHDLTKQFGSAGLRAAEYLPDLIPFLKQHPELKAISKVVQAFCDANPERKLVKKWVADSIKDIAERGINGWRIKAEMPAAIEALKDEKKNEGPKSTDREENPGANQQTLLSVLQKGANHPVNSAPKSEAELSLAESKAEGTFSPGWRLLADSLAQQKSAYTVQTVDKLFNIVRSCEDATYIPAFVVSAMLKTLASTSAPMQLREGCATYLAHIVDLLNASEPEVLSPPSKVWGNSRTAPTAISLEELLSNQQLPEILFESLRSLRIDLASATACLIRALLATGAMQAALCQEGCTVDLEGLHSEAEASAREGLQEAKGVARLAQPLKCKIAGDHQFLALLTDCERDTRKATLAKLQSLCYLMESKSSAQKLRASQPGLKSIVKLICSLEEETMTKEMVSWRIRGVNLLLEVLLTIEDPLSVLTKDCISDGIHDSALVQFAQILRTRLTSLDTCSSATQGTKLLAQVVTTCLYNKEGDQLANSSDTKDSIKHFKLTVQDSLSASNFLFAFLESVRSSNL